MLGKRVKRKEFITQRKNYGEWIEMTNCDIKIPIKWIELFDNLIKRLLTKKN